MISGLKIGDELELKNRDIDDNNKYIFLGRLCNVSSCLMFMVHLTEDDKDVAMKADLFNYKIKAKLPIWSITIW